MSLKNGGFSSRPPATLLFAKSELQVGGGAPHNGDFGRRRGAS